MKITGNWDTIGNQVNMIAVLMVAIPALLVVDMMTQPLASMRLMMGRLMP